MGELPTPDLNYLALPHRVLADNVKDIDPGAVGEYARVWQDVARALFDLGQDMRSSLNSESASWRGQAAEAVFHFSAKLSEFAEKTGESDVDSAKASDASASVGSWAKHAMPEPVEFDRQAAFNEAAGRFMAGDAAGGMAEMEKLDRKQQAAEEAHQEAARVSAQHAMTLFQTHSQGLEFAEPPSLSDSMAKVSDGSGAKVGGVDGTVPAIGVGGATSASSTNASPPGGGSGGPSVHGGPPPGGASAGPPSPGKISGILPGPSQGPPGGTPAPPVRVPAPGPAALLPVSGPRGQGEDSRTSKSPFASTGRGPGGAAGPRATGGPGAPGSKGAVPPGSGKATGGVPGEGQVPMGARAAAAAAGARPGAGPGVAGGHGNRARDDEKEHKNKYVQPEALEDGLYDDDLGYSADPRTGHPLVRPVIGENADTGSQPRTATSRPDRSEPQ